MFDIINNIRVELIEVIHFLKNPQQTSKLLGTFLKIFLILIITRVSLKVLHSLINKFFDTQKNLKLEKNIPRIETMKSLTNSIVRYTIYFISFASIIKYFGIDIAPLIATAGIGGLAIGFGAQNLVRDIITGFFILLEEQFSVGDYVGIDGINGIVEEMTLRVTKIRGFDGDLHIIPNGEISIVTNKSSGKMRALVNMSISHEEDIDRAIEILAKTSENIKKENPDILEGPTVIGVTNILDTGIELRVVAHTIPMKQWAIERLMRKEFKQAFTQHGIEVPYPKRVIIEKKDER
ncbi:MAG: mechanosensitive ion channel family protein [Clostridiales bacterium]|nr:mechanosensitive ion channel family protein [Clostridiales bacterium]